MVDLMTADARSGPETPVRRKKVRPKKVTPYDSQITHDSRDEQIAALTAQLRIQDEDSRRLRDENTLLKAYIGESPASYTEGGNVRLMQWNLQDLTNGGEVQGPLWEEERLRNIVNTILFHKPDVVAIEEVKAGDGGLAAFKQIRGRLRPHGYEGDYSDAVSGGPRGERVGLIWRTRLADEGAVTFNLLVNVNGIDGRANAEDENTVAAAATCIGLDVQETVNACASAFREPLPSRTSKSHFDRHLVLATLQTNLGKPLGKPLHVLIGHLATKTNHNTEGNTAEVNVIKELASRAWAAGAWLFVMADTNTDEAENRGIWDGKTTERLRSSNSAVAHFRADTLRTFTLISMPSKTKTAAQSPSGTTKYSPPNGVSACPPKRLGFAPPRLAHGRRRLRNCLWMWKRAEAPEEASEST